MAAQVLQLSLPLRQQKKEQTPLKQKRPTYRFQVTVTEACRHAGKAIIYETTAVSEINARRNGRVKYNQSIGRIARAFVAMTIKQLD